MKKVFNMTVICILIFTSYSYRVSANECSSKCDNKLNGYVILDYENAKKITKENGDIYGEIPLILYTSDGERNITMPDGSIYRYGYMAGAHAWHYEFVINGGFSSYNGSVSLVPRLQTSPNGYWSTSVSARTDVVYLPYSLKDKSIVSQSGVVRGANGKKYIVPSITIYV